MTSTSVVLGIAAAGTPGAPTDCDCATDAAGSAATRKGSNSFTSILLDGGFSLAYLIFARGAGAVTRLRMIVFSHETGHKDASRGKELNGERRRSRTSRSDDALSGRIARSI